MKAGEGFEVFNRLEAMSLRQVVLLPKLPGLLKLLNGLPRLSLKL